MSQKKTCKCKGTVCGQGAPGCCVSCPCRQLGFDGMDKVEGSLKPYSDGIPIEIVKIIFKNGDEVHITAGDYLNFRQHSKWSPDYLMAIELHADGLWRYASKSYPAYRDDMVSNEPVFEGKICRF